MADRIQSLDDDAFAQALTWHVRLNGSPANEDWLEFTAWLEADPENRAAFDRADALAGELAEMKPALIAAQPGPRLVASNPVPQPMTQPERGPIARGVWIGRVAAGLVAIAAAVAVVVLGPSSFLPAPARQAWSTRVGEHQSVKLEDGSEIHLNTNTVLSASIGRDARSVNLEKGEVLIDVVSDPGRPFVVAMGDRRVEVVGTAFNILRHEGRRTVTVTRGIVNVVREGTDTSPPVRLTAGDQFTDREGESDYGVRKVDTSSAVSWRTGHLNYEDAPLSEIVADLNRYFLQQVIVEGDDVRNLRFTGSLKIDDQPGVLHRLEGFLPVTVQARGDTLVLARRAKE